MPSGIRGRQPYMAVGQRSGDSQGMAPFPSAFQQRESLGSLSEGRSEDRELSGFPFECEIEFPLPPLQALPVPPFPGHWSAGRMGLLSFLKGTMSAPEPVCSGQPLFPTASVTNSSLTHPLLTHSPTPLIWLNSTDSFQLSLSQASFLCSCGISSAEPPQTFQHYLKPFKKVSVLSPDL